MGFTAVTLIQGKRKIPVHQRKAIGCLEGPFDHISSRLWSMRLAIAVGRLYFILEGANARKPALKLKLDTLSAKLRNLLPLLADHLTAEGAVFL